ncbi:MAG: phosphonate metabolism protein/1,5-bisphosphokinase (PRPP-forming) PhnN [Burkholderiaceae bacterium]|jgi:ribose 1,5-bisphosphokinase|nr:phosphonate metabolism protein/1,5-bisphosphokinase (PRPP-forming) PhnN [Burkholderiaceae bacterium]
MTRRLIYVVGPSGAGKDSVLDGLRQSWSDLPPAHWARRTITRAARADGERHESVSPPAFAHLHQSGVFAMHWQANGLRYGVRHAELTPLSDGRCVLVNGSRAWVPALLRQWPGCTVVHITAPPDVLMRRLAARSREDAPAIAARLARQVEFDMPASAIHVINDGPLATAVDTLRAALQARLAGEGYNLTAVPAAEPKSPVR